MIHHGFGRPDQRAPRTAATHYEITEATHLHLQMLAATLHSLRILADRVATDQGSDFQDIDAAPLFALLADYADRLIAECAVVLAGARS